MTSLRASIPEAVQPALTSLALLVFACIYLAAQSAQGQDSQSTVGIPKRIESLILPGPELEAKPASDRKNPVIIQVAKVYPHGSLFRYDIEYTGLEPGTHDLRPYLKRKDGSPLGDLPPIQVVVKPVLPPGQVKPNELVIEKGPRLGGYRVLAAVLALAWLAGLAALVYTLMPRKRNTTPQNAPSPLSVADKLRPLVEGAVAGRLSRSELAGLERGLLAWWRRHLALEQADPASAVEKLRNHPQAGPLLAQLEAWLHKPAPIVPVDVQALLEPYLHLPAEDLDATGGLG